MRRVVAIPFAVAAAVLVVIWGGGILYWHVRITRALRAWEQHPKVVYHLSSAPDYGPPEAAATLQEAGGRALPYLIHQLDESKDPRFLEGLTDRIIVGTVVQCPGDEHFLYERIGTWFIGRDDRIPDRREKCLRIRAWWEENGGRYYQWWRFWSP